MVWPLIFHGPVFRTLAWSLLLVELNKKVLSSTSSTAKLFAKLQRCVKLSMLPVVDGFKRNYSFHQGQVRSCTSPLCFLD
jgi:hypothetical protein